jgi:uncharacterized Zn-binding protein involved in type VI secretion
MKQAARLGDRTEHDGYVAEASSNVLINGIGAARLEDDHKCHRFFNLNAHIGGPIKTGSGSVLINGRPAARVTDKAVCRAGPDDEIAQGSSNVMIGD